MGKIRLQQNDHVHWRQVPDTNSSRLSPVMVFIYGGGFASGGSSLYYPDRLLREEDIVLVTPHYRLGVLGQCSTLRHSGTRSTSDGEPPPPPRQCSVIVTSEW